MEGERILKLCAIVITTLFVALCRPSCAASLDDNAILDAVQDLSATEYWSKGPLALLSYCGEKYPETGKAAMVGYQRWVSSNADYVRRLDAVQKYFVPIVAKRMNKSTDDYDLRLTKMTNEGVIQQLEQGLDEGQRHARCGDFPGLLDAMFATDLVKPRVTIAIENLERLKRAVR